MNYNLKKTFTFAENFKQYLINLQQKLCQTHISGSKNLQSGKINAL